MGYIDLYTSRSIYLYRGGETERGREDGEDIEIYFKELAYVLNGDWQVGNV